MKFEGRKFFLLTTCFVIVLCSSFQLVRADITLAKIFSDHMVLQRNSKVPINGTADPQQALDISFNQKSYQTTADSSGAWSTTIEIPKSGGPFELVVAAVEGQPKVVVSDILVGEVWLCAGEANMNFKVAESLNSENEIELSKTFPIYACSELVPIRRQNHCTIFRRFHHGMFAVLRQ